MEVAVKTLKPAAKEEDKVKFLQEAAIMGQFNHPNVVKLFGVITMGEPVSDSDSSWVAAMLVCVGVWWVGGEWERMWPYIYINETDFLLVFK